MLNVGSTVFGDWVVDEKIGSGAFGTVYKIKREDFGNVYYAALKEINIPQSVEEQDNLRAEGMDEKSISTYYGQIAQDFVKEIKMLSALDGITNIVDYKDHMIIPREPYGYTIHIKMQLLTPLTKKLIDTNNNVAFLSQEEIIDLGIDICSALQVCEKYNIIHRDIKIDNIFVSANGDYKLGDFGIAKKLEATQGEMSKKGTLLYMAPEVFKGERYNNTADIYSLGIVLYRLLNKNRAPFLPSYPAQIRFSDKEEANVRRLSGERLPDIAGVNNELMSAIRVACAFNPDDRFKSAQAFRNALKAAKKISQQMSNVKVSVNTDIEKTSSAFNDTPVKANAAPVFNSNQGYVNQNVNLGHAQQSGMAYGYYAQSQPTHFGYAQQGQDTYNRVNVAQPVNSQYAYSQQSNINNQQCQTPVNTAYKQNRTVDQSDSVHVNKSSVIATQANNPTGVQSPRVNPAVARALAQREQEKKKNNTITIIVVIVFLALLFFFIVGVFAEMYFIKVDLSQTIALCSDVAYKILL